MAKYNLDEILSELGVGNQQNAPRNTKEEAKRLIQPAQHGLVDPA